MPSVAQWDQWICRAQCRSPFLDLSLDSKVCSRFSASKWPKPTQNLPRPGVLQNGLSIRRKSGCLLAQKQTLPLTILCYLGTETRFQWGRQESFMVESLLRLAKPLTSTVTDRHWTMLQRACLSSAALPCQEMDSQSPRWYQFANVKKYFKG